MVYVFGGYLSTLEGIAGLQFAVEVRMLDEVPDEHMPSRPRDARAGKRLRTEGLGQPGEETLQFVEAVEDRRVAGRIGISPLDDVTAVLAMHAGGPEELPPFGQCLRDIVPQGCSCVSG